MRSWAQQGLSDNRRHRGRARETWRRLGPSASMALGLAALLWLGGCAEQAEPTPESGDQPGSIPEDRAALRASAENPAAQPVDTPDAAAIALRVAALAAKLERPSAGRTAAIAKIDEGRKVVESLAAEGKLLFYKFDGNLTADGSAVLALLAELERHGVPTRPYHFERIDAATAQVTLAFAAEREVLLKAATSSKGAQVVAALARWLRTGNGSALDLERAGIAELDARARLAIDQRLDDISAATVTARAALWAADSEIARAVVRYVVDFTLAHPLHPHEPTSAATIRKLADKNADALIARLQGKRGAIAEAMRAAWPTQPQYAALLEAADRYAALVKAGDWQPLPKLVGAKLERGARGPFVVALRDRLDPARVFGNAYLERVLGP